MLPPKRKPKQPKCFYCEKKVSLSKSGKRSLGWTQEEGYFHFNCKIDDIKKESDKDE